jgi:hypothetical protein
MDGTDIEHALVSGVIMMVLTLPLPSAILVLFRSKLIVAKDDITPEGGEPSSDTKNNKKTGKKDNVVDS